jgi:molybdopterin adenylyltransferase
MTAESLKVGVITVSDRAFSGEYEDKGGPAILDWLGKALVSEWKPEARVVPDEQDQIETLLKDLVDREDCNLILTTGGTGPAKRDVTPEATMAIADKVMDGFGERMRSISLKYVPTAILSRQLGVIRGNCLIINLPGQPKAIKETLDELFEAIPYCIDLIDGPYVETDEAIVKAFRPKSAIRSK